MRERELKMKNVNEIFEIEVDEEDVFENGVLVVEDVSNEEGDDSGVLVYSYNGKYVVMSFDFGGSLCEMDVYESLDDVKKLLEV